MGASQSASSAGKDLQKALVSQVCRAAVAFTLFEQAVTGSRQMKVIHLWPSSELLDALPEKLRAITKGLNPLLSPCDIAALPTRSGPLGWPGCLGWS
jgi:hypothetical protein